MLQNGNTHIVPQRIHIIAENLELPLDLKGKDIFLMTRTYTSLIVKDNCKGNQLIML
ncbi:hypothetical protein HanPI659440_Chr01g0030491 [Helianthus annuus]|nr:hypothetical protein HanPI659440_Chr01g0030491 [Helianthus annuus]